MAVRDPVGLAELEVPEVLAAPGVLIRLTMTAALEEQGAMDSRATPPSMAVAAAAERPVAGSRSTALVEALGNLTLPGVSERAGQ